MQFPGSRTSNTTRKRTAVAAVVAVAVAGGLLFNGATQASAAPSPDCTVQGPKAGMDAAVTDLNSGKKFTNLYKCETQIDAGLYAPATEVGFETKNQPFGKLNKGSNWIVCWSSSLPKTKDGYNWMLTFGDEPLPGHEAQFDLDWDPKQPANSAANSWKNNKKDASADRFGWVSSRILGTAPGARPLNIAECGAGEVGSKVVDPTAKKAATAGTAVNATPASNTTNASNRSDALQTQSTGTQTNTGAAAPAAPAPAVSAESRRLKEAELKALNAWEMDQTNQQKRTAYLQARQAYSNSIQ